MSLVVFDGMLTWHEAETMHLTKLKALIGKSFFTLLTNGKVEYMEDMFGEIPKDRSAFRKKMKQLLTRFAGRP